MLEDTNSLDGAHMMFVLMMVFININIKCLYAETQKAHIKV